jgi:hypothetical protein
LLILGPITVFKLKLAPRDFSYGLVVEQWNYPDGSRIVELSTKCMPNEAFQAGLEARAYLTGIGIDISGEQQTKTAAALDFFIKEARAENGGKARTKKTTQG